MGKFYVVVPLLIICILMVIMAGCQQQVGKLGVVPRNVTLAAGESTQLQATAFDSGGMPLSGVQIGWISSDTGIATVTANGVVTGVNPGTAIITAVVGGGSATDKVSVTVGAAKPVLSSISITPTSPNVNVGETLQLTATGIDNNGEVMQGLDFTWSSSSTGVATVNSQGLVTGVTPGTADVSVKSGNITGTITVIVNQPAAATTPPPPKPAALTYETGAAQTQMKPIIDARCVTCHKPGGAMSGAPLTNYQEVKKQVDSGKFVSQLNGSMAPFAGDKKADLIKWAQSGAPQ